MNYIIIYLEIKHLLNFLTQEEKGDFLDLLIEYGENQKVPNIENKNVLNVFNFIKDRLDKQIEKAMLKAEVARANGANGGRPKKGKNPKKPKGNQPKPNGFIPPTLQEVKDYCLERNRGVNPEKWINHYEAKGWKIGKDTMKDWKAAVRTWEEPEQPKINLCQEINQICGSELLTKIEKSGNKAALHFAYEADYKELIALPESTRNKIKEKISKSLGTEGYEFIY